MPNSKIFVVYHKNAPLVQNDVFVPIRVGKFAEDASNNLLADNTGDNIAHKNPYYNEMTAIYWLWKNYDEIGNPDYIGLNHYRRYFIFKGSKYAYFESQSIDDIFEQINFCNGKVEEIFKSYDFIVPVPNKRKSVYHNYKVSHNIEDLELVLKILKEKYPEFTEAADKYIYGKGVYFYNMFVFKRQDFFNYCEWIFSVLDEYEKQTQRHDKRFYVSERLTGIYITYLKMQGMRPAHLPVLFIKDKKPTLKQAKQMCKQNLKDKNMSKLHAYKPLIAHFVPNKLILMRRRKSALKRKEIFKEN